MSAQNSLEQRSPSESIDTKRVVFIVIDRVSRDWAVALPPELVWQLLREGIDDGSRERAESSRLVRRRLVSEGVRLGDYFTDLRKALIFECFALGVSAPELPPILGFTGRRILNQFIRREFQTTTGLLERAIQSVQEEFGPNGLVTENVSLEDRKVV